MKRWLLVPLAVFALVSVTPSTQGGWFRNRNCGSDCGAVQCGPAQTIVGYRTETREVTVSEWVTEKRKIKVVENRIETEKRKIKVVENRIEAEKRKVERLRQEMVKETRPEKYWVCQPITTEENREYTIHRRVEEKKSEVRKVTVDRGGFVTQTQEVVCYSHARRGCCRRGCDDDCGVYTTTVCRNVWVPKLETIEQKYDYVVCSYVPEKKVEKVKVTRYQRVEQVRNVDYWFCKTTPVTEEITVNVCRPITVEREVEVRVCRPITVEREVEVRVCRPAVRKVEVRVPVYGVVECAAPAPAPVSYSDCGYSGYSSGCGGRRRGCCR